MSYISVMGEEQKIRSSILFILDDTFRKKEQSRCGCCMNLDLLHLWMHGSASLPHIHMQIFQQPASCVTAHFCDVMH